MGNRSRGGEGVLSEKRAGTDSTDLPRGGKFPSRAILSQGMSFPLFEVCKMCPREIRTISTEQGHPRPYTPEVHSPDFVLLVTGERAQAEVQVFIRVVHYICPGLSPGSLSSSRAQTHLCTWPDKG